MTDRDYIKTSEYIIGVLRTVVGGEPLPNKPTDVSWHGVYSLAKHHSLASTLYSYIEADLLKDAPSELVWHWKKERDIDFVKNVKQTSAFSEITELFTREKLAFLPLKGFMMKKLYPRPELRTMADMDIYVSEKQADRARDMLISIGYKCERDPNEEEIHDQLLKPPFINVELHKVLYKGSDFSFEDCTPREDNPYWYVMKDEDFFLFMLRHTHKHYTHGGCGIRAVLDFYLYKKAHPEILTEKVENVIKESGLSDFYKKISALADKWFAASETGEDIAGFELFTVTGGTYGTFETRMQVSIKESGKLKYSLSRIFPPVKILKKRYKWVRKCVLLVPFAYIVRIVESIFNGRIKWHLKTAKKANEKNKKTK